MAPNGEGPVPALRPNAEVVVAFPNAEVVLVLPKGDGLAPPKADEALMLLPKADEALPPPKGDDVLATFLNGDEVLEAVVPNPDGAPNPDFTGSLSLFAVEPCVPNADVPKLNFNPPDGAFVDEEGGLVAGVVLAVAVFVAEAGVVGVLKLNSDAPPGVGVGTDADAEVEPPVAAAAFEASEPKAPLNEEPAPLAAPVEGAEAAVVLFDTPKLNFNPEPPLDGAVEVVAPFAGADEVPDEAG